MPPQLIAFFVNRPSRAVVPMAKLLAQISLNGVVLARSADINAKGPQGWVEYIYGGRLPTCFLLTPTECHEHVKGLY